MKRLGVELGSLGIVLAAMPAAAAVPPANHLIPKVRSQVFDIAYQVNEAALPLQSASLWYTLDRGATWRNYGRDEDAQSPVKFHAPQEALYGFFIVAANESGVSGNNPDSTTEPQQWALVDFTPPIVQLNAVELDHENTAAPTLTVRWTALDTQMPARPVELAYRGVPSGEWTTIARDLANTGRYDWRIPEGVRGSVIIRLIVRDQGGHAVEALSSPVDIAWPAKVNETKTTPARDNAMDTKIPLNDRVRAQTLAERAGWHARRGEFRFAVARYRDVLAINPGLDDALVGLGDALYALGELDSASEAYELLLKRRPSQAPALEGLARIFIAQKNYPAAAEKLGLLVREKPDDVASWLELGDLAFYQGDQLMAADYYHRAATLDPAAVDIVVTANARLSGLQAPAQPESLVDHRP